MDDDSATASTILPAPAETLEALEERLGWISLSKALAHINPVDAGVAWEHAKVAVKHGQLRMKGSADGVEKDFLPEWLDFLASDDPRDDLLIFSSEKAARKGAQVPKRIWAIKVRVSDMRRLWPGAG